jgi:predicted glutamine amidotransferase
MCRLFGMLSAKPYQPVKFLIKDKCSLLKQSNAKPKKFQADGWGVAYLDGRMKLVKSAGAVFEEAEKFRNIVSEINSNLILAHLRRASNPRRLPKEQLMNIGNVQPFVSPGLTFIHNGTVNKPNNIDLGEYRAMVDGDSDSEVLYWLLVKCLVEEGTVKGAIISMEKSLEMSVKEGTKPFTAVNIIFSDGKNLHAYCRYFTQPGKSLCMGSQGYYIMSFLPGKDRIVVMSEPSNEDPKWRTLDNGELLSARIEDRCVNFKTEKLSV